MVLLSTKLLRLAQSKKQLINKNVKKNEMNEN